MISTISPVKSAWKTFQNMPFVLFLSLIGLDSYGRDSFPMGILKSEIEREEICEELTNKKRK